MRRYRQLLVLFFVLYALASRAQVNHADSLFTVAKNKVAANDIPGAITTMLELQTAFPDNAGYAVYLGRLYYWTGTYELAKQLLETPPGSGIVDEETTLLRANVNYALDRYTDAIVICDEAILHFPGAAHQYRLIKALCLEKLNRNEEALNELNMINDTADNWRNADYLRTQILRKQKNIVSAGYMNSSFSNGPAPFHFAHIEYAHKFRRHTGVFRVNYAYAFSKNDVQPEADGYITLNKRSYLYMNTGFSVRGGVFPLMRVGLEYYRSSGKLSSSLGARYLHFESVQVPMFTGHVALNFRSVKIEYRPFVSWNSNVWLSSHVLNVRLFSERKESWIQLDVQYGGLPYYYFTGEVTRTSAYRAGVSGCVRIARNFFVQATYMYEREEFLPDQFRDRTNIQLILSRRF